MLLQFQSNFVRSTRNMEAIVIQVKVIPLFFVSWVVGTLKSTRLIVLLAIIGYINLITRAVYPR